LPPLVAALGHWPARLVILLALALLGFVVVLLPWLVVPRAQSRRAG
jgi:hypothetical protein